MKTGQLMMYRRLPYLLILALSLSAVPFSTWAGVVDIATFGFAYHLDANEAYPDAPRALDSKGQTVFNPGLGLGYDFRKSDTTAGLSWAADLGFFDDCAAKQVYFAGAGAHYTYALSQNVSVGARLMATILNGKDWDTRTRNTSLKPLASVEMSFHIAKSWSFRPNILYAPKDSSISATDGSDLLFVFFVFSFTLDHGN
jgi:hypothetical protein